MRFKREADAYGVATARNGVRPISRERCYLLLLLLLAIDDLSTRRRGGGGYQNGPALMPMKNRQEERESI